MVSFGLPVEAAASYAPCFLRQGFDSPTAIRTLTPHDFASLGVKEGHKRLILQHLEDGRGSTAEEPNGFHVPGHAKAACSAAGEPAAIPGKAAAGKVRAAKAKRARVAGGAVLPRGSGLPLDGLTLCVSGAMSMVRREFHRFLMDHGASVVISVTGNTTHLVTTQAEADCPTRKVLGAMSKGTPIVSEDYIHACIANGAVVDAGPYMLVDGADAGGAAAWPAGSRSGRGGASGVGVPPAAHRPAAASSSTSCAPAAAAPAAAGAAAPSAHRDIVFSARAAGAVVEIRSDRASEDAARQVMLAHKLDPKLDPTGWWISEKLDGVRGYWDGKNFYSRLGNQFPAPEWFKEGLPASPLDGELWCGRRQFRRCLSIVRNRSSGKLWEFITYLVFDAPAMKAGYEERVEYIKKSVVPGKAGAAEGCPYAAPVGIVRCTGLAQLRAELRKVTAKGGEGLMLRKPNSAYESGRSRVLQKVKPTNDEEARVIGHEGGQGAKGFHCGALTLETPDGRRFSCGSGLSARDRQDPPAIGTVVTFRFTELMDNGYPRFPVYVGPRIDLDWAAYCASYAPPTADKFKGGELKRKHSIMYSEAALESTLSARAVAASELAPVPGEGGAWASEGSEGGDTEAEGARKSKNGRAGGGGPRKRPRAETAEKAAVAAEKRALDAKKLPAPGRLWRGASSTVLNRAASSTLHRAATRKVEPSNGVASSGSSTGARASNGLIRSRSAELAEAAGIDRKTARDLLAEHDVASSG